MSAPSPSPAPRRGLIVPLRGLFVLALLIASMAAMLALKSRMREDVSDAVTFAAVGFVVLAAYAMAELASSVGLPRVTGYILAGIGLGPSAASMMGIDPPLLPADSVADMAVFKSLALALIALEAGLELSLDAMKRFRKTLGGIILFKIPLSWLMIGGTLVLLGSTVFPVDGAGTLESLIALGLVLGAIGVGTSPAVSVAVISESGAKGKTADLVLGFAVFKDVVMVVMLGLAIAVGNPLATGAEFDGAILVDLLKTIAMSIVVGVALGGLLIAWMRWVRWENILMLLVLAYGIQPVDSWFHHELHIHLKPLLVFIAAGFVVGNFSRYGHDLHKPLAMLALPVFVIFFTTAGAGLELESTIAVLPLAAALFFARLAMMFLATRFGGKLAKEPRPYTNVLWMGFISQAGVALVLLGLAAEQLPALKVPIQQVGFALIALNLLIGPVLLRIALKKGPAALAAAEGAGAIGVGGVAAAGAEGDASRRDEVPLPEPVEAALADVEEAVRAIVVRAGEGIAGSFVTTANARESDAASRLEAVAMAPYADGLAHAARSLRDRLIELPILARLPLSESQLDAPEGAGLSRKIGALAARVGYLFGRRHRTLGLRSFVRARIEREVTGALSALLDALARAELARLDAIGSGAPEGSETFAASAEAAERAFVERVEAALVALRRGLGDVGTPQADDGPEAYSDVAREVDRALGRLDQDGGAWDKAIARVAARALIRHRLAAARDAMRGHCDAAIKVWTRGRRDAVSSVLKRFAEALGAARRDLLGDKAREAGRAGLDAVIEGLEGIAAAEILPALAELRAGDGAASLRELDQHLEAALVGLPASVVVAPARFRVTDTTRPEDVTGEERQAAGIVGRFVGAELKWSLAETRAEEDDIAARVGQRLSELVGAVTVGLRAGLDEVAARGEGDAANVAARLHDFAAETIARAHATTAELESGTRRELARVPESIGASIEDTLHRIQQRLLGEPGDEEEVPQTGLAKLRRAGRAVADAFERVRGKVVGWAVLRYQAFMGSDLVRRARQQTGSERVDPARMAADVAALSPAPAQLARLPYVLARLFTPGTVDTPHLLAGVEGATAALEAAHTRHKAGARVSVLVRGDAGSGRTSLTRVTLRRLAGRALVEVPLGPEHRSESALAEAIASRLEGPGTRSFKALEKTMREPGRVVLLDGLEHIFVRNAQGLGLMRALLRLVAATGDSTLWVCTVAEPTARLLERLADLGAYFTDHIALTPHGAAELGTLLETRCRLSGFEIVWPGETGEVRSRLARVFRRRRPTSDELRARFLQRLARLSGGNLRDALNLFINAIDEVGVADIRPRAVSTPDLGWFDQLGRDAQRLLAATVVSGSLTTRESQDTLLFGAARIAAARARLLGAGLLEVMPDGDRARVAPYAWRRVRDLLVARNALLDDPRAEGGRR